MHIPDGYLSPETCAVMYGAAAPFWVMAARRVRKVVKTRYVPLLALGAAYCFLVMMFNVPIPDGTTAHAVGGVLVAVLVRGRLDGRLLLHVVRDDDRGHRALA